MPDIRVKSELSRYGDEPDSIPDRGKMCHLCYIKYGPILRPIQPIIKCVPEGDSPGLKQKGRETDYSVPFY
jgi:hypothetical protein